MGVYNSLLVNHPVKTKIATCAFIAALGDIACQQITQGKINNYERTLSMAGVAGFLQTPVFHAYLQRIYPMLQANTFAG